MERVACTAAVGTFVVSDTFLQKRLDTKGGGNILDTSTVDANGRSNRALFLLEWLLQAGPPCAAPPEELDRSRDVLEALKKLSGIDPHKYSTAGDFEPDRVKQLADVIAGAVRELDHRRACEIHEGDSDRF